MSHPHSRLMPPSLAAFTGSAFHYTSSNGLLGTLQTQSVWASAASSLNDLGEVRQGWDLIRRILGDLPASASVDMLQRFADDPMDAQHEVFVLSASTRNDDANQWRLYADGGYGYAIELDASVPLAAVSDVPVASAPAVKPSIGMPIGDAAAVSPWRPVLYTEAEVETALSELVGAVENEEQSIRSTTGMPDEEYDFAFQSLQGDAYEALSTIAHLIKSPGFAGENEVRVVTTFMWGEKHIRYRSSRYGIVGYATLTESLGGPRRSVIRPTAVGAPAVTSLPIQSVTLGPLLRSEHANTLQAFLRQAGLKEVEIHTSAVPLR